MARVSAMYLSACRRIVDTETRSIPRACAGLASATVAIVAATTASHSDALRTHVPPCSLTPAEDRPLLAAPHGGRTIVDTRSLPPRVPSHPRRLLLEKVNRRG